MATKLQDVVIEVRIRTDRAREELKRFDQRDEKERQRKRKRGDVRARAEGRKIGRGEGEAGAGGGGSTTAGVLTGAAVAKRFPSGLKAGLALAGSVAALAVLAERVILPVIEGVIQRTVKELLASESFVNRQLGDILQALVDDNVIQLREEIGVLTKAVDFVRSSLSAVGQTVNFAKNASLLGRMPGAEVSVDIFNEARAINEFQLRMARYGESAGIRALSNNLTDLFIRGVQGR